MGPEGVGVTGEGGARDSREAGHRKIELFIGPDSPVGVAKACRIGLVGVTRVHCEKGRDQLQNFGGSRAKGWTGCLTWGVASQGRGQVKADQGLPTGELPDERVNPKAGISVRAQPW